MVRSPSPPVSSLYGILRRESSGGETSTPDRSKARPPPPRLRPSPQPPWQLATSDPSSRPWATRASPPRCATPRCPATCSRPPWRLSDLVLRPQPGPQGPTTATCTIMLIYTALPRQGTPCHTLRPCDTNVTSISHAGLTTCDEWDADFTPRECDTFCHIFGPFRGPITVLIGRGSHAAITKAPGRPCRKNTRAGRHARSQSPCRPAAGAAGAGNRLGIRTVSLPGETCHVRDSGKPAAKRSTGTSTNHMTWPVLHGPTPAHLGLPVTRAYSVKQGRPTMDAAQTAHRALCANRRPLRTGSPQRQFNKPHQPLAHPLINHFI